MSNNAPRRPLSRRNFIANVARGAVAAPAILHVRPGFAWSEGTEMFPLGVVSGDPTDSSIEIWTRLVEDPLADAQPDFGPVPVMWEIATDPGMRHIVRRGYTHAAAQNGYAVNASVHGLPPDVWLYYRFVAYGKLKGHSSRVGRTRTFPGRYSLSYKHKPWGYRGYEHCRTEEMRFALVSCQNYVQGYFPAWADIAKQDLDFVLHSGDYIYENGASSTPLFADRNHTGGEIFSVADYRRRYAQYRLDQDLQDAHAQFPFLVTWDDHEVDNNYAGLIAEEGAPFVGEDFVQRRRNAYRVYSESMPLRLRARRYKHGKKDFASFDIYRSLAYGKLADIHILDTRQYRSDQPAGDGFGSTDVQIDPLTAGLLETIFDETLFDAAGIGNPKATMLGYDQEAWLAKRLMHSKAKWNVLAQQVMVMPWNLRATAQLNVQFGPDFPGKDQALAAIGNLSDVLNVDAWDGYPAARQRLVHLLEKYRPSNPVILTGDIHSSWAANILGEEQQTLAVEFVCTSISSTFLSPDPRPVDAIVRAGLPDNPHIRHFSGLFRGYSLCEVDSAGWTTRFRAVGDPSDIASPDPLALVPLPGEPVFTEAVASVPAGFNQPATPASLAIS